LRSARLEFCLTSLLPQEYLQPVSKAGPSPLFLIIPPETGFRPHTQATGEAPAYGATSNLPHVTAPPKYLQPICRAGPLLGLIPLFTWRRRHATKGPRRERGLPSPARRAWRHHCPHDLPATTAPKARPHPRGVGKPGSVSALCPREQNLVLKEDHLTSRAVASALRVHGLLTPQRACHVRRICLDSTIHARKTRNWHKNY